MNTPVQKSPVVMTVLQVPEYLGCHASTIYRLLKKGELPYFRLGSDYRFNKEEIDEWRLKGFTHTFQSRARPNGSDDLREMATSTAPRALGLPNPARPRRT